jgi:hypothetical protein
MNPKMYLRFIPAILVTIFLSLVTACTTESQDQATPKNNSITEKPTPTASNQSIKNRRQNKTVTTSIEGKEIPVNLQLYQNQNLFSTYFPEQDFLIKTENDSTGKGVKFFANFAGVKNENAYVKFVFPDKFKNLEELRNFINGKNGIIASNNWKIVSSSSAVNYPWAKEKIAFSKGVDIVGDIYLGEENGKVFYVITQFPLEYGDGFSPREDLILSNLEIGE